MINVTTYVTDTPEDFASVIAITQDGGLSYVTLSIATSMFGMIVDPLEDFANQPITQDGALSYVTLSIANSLFGRVTDKVTEFPTGVGGVALTQRWAV